MSEFIVKGPEVYAELGAAFQKINQVAPTVIPKVEEVIKNIQKKLETDLLETAQELKKKTEEIDGAEQQLENSKNDQNNPESNKNNDGSNQLAHVHQLKREQDDLKQKEQGLKNALANINHLLHQVNQCENNILNRISETKKATSALSQFEALANQYINLTTPSSTSSSSSSSSSSASTRTTNVNNELIGDTLHVNWDRGASINQTDLDRLEQSLGHGEMQKAQKISFSGFSQNDFVILKKNGYTIQPLGDNKYSAYREF
jgi:chromosome segregation ATPase